MTPVVSKSKLTLNEATGMTLEKCDGMEELENFIFQRMTESGIPGLSIAVIKEGEILYKR